MDGHNGNLGEMRTKTHQSKNRNKENGKWDSHQNQKNRKQEIGNPSKKRKGGSPEVTSHPRPTNREPKTHQSKNRKPKQKQEIH
jgi:hypothetical protein